VKSKSSSCRTAKIKDNKSKRASDPEQSVKERLSSQEWTSEQIREEIKNDLTLGMDSLYRVKIKHPKQNFRIVAPFVEYALNPPKKYTDAFSPGASQSRDQEQHGKDERVRVFSKQNGHTRSYESGQFSPQTKHPQGLKLMGSSPFNALPNFIH